MKTAEWTKPRNARQLVWDVLQNARGDYLTAEEVAQQAGVTFQTAYGYMAKLFKGGFIAAYKGSRFTRSAAYCLIKSTGREAPHLNSDGTSGKGSKEEAIWRSIKIFNRFTAESLHAHVAMTHTAGMNQVKNYLAALARAGYLRETGKGRYLLVNNTGAHAPRLIRAEEVYDPNLNQITLREVADYE